MDHTGLDGRLLSARHSGCRQKTGPRIAWAKSEAPQGASAGTFTSQITEGHATTP